MEEDQPPKKMNSIWTRKKEEKDTKNSGTKNMTNKKRYIQRKHQNTSRGKNEF